MKDTALKYQLFFLSLSVLLLPSLSFAQSFFKILNTSDQYYNQKIDRFSNGDLLICDSSLEALSTGEETGELILHRMDKCGNEVWSKSYNYEDGYLEFKDFVISETDEVFIYGSHYKGLQEFIFIAKFDGANGANLGLRLFNPGTVDHFSYSVDIKNGRIMTYGLLFDFNTLKLGFIGVFDEGLNFQWAKKFEPFHSNGDAIISSEDGFLGRSGEYLIKLSSNGEAEWASTLNQDEGLRMNKGPIEITDGFLFEMHREGNSFFFKINAEGQLVWQTKLFAATDAGAAISMMSDGNFLCTYNAPKGEGSEICQLLLTADGIIEDQKRLMLEEQINTGTLYQHLIDDELITIAGNANPTALNPVDFKDFILQFDLSSSDNDCFQWESFDDTFLNTYLIEFSDHTVIPETFEMVEEARINLDAINFDWALDDFCTLSNGLIEMEIDTLLDCGESWSINLPGTDFLWTDNNSNNSRVLYEPGTYQARKQDCNNPVVIDYTLNILDCPCEVSLPNIFTPNNDGFNDQLEIFTDCPMDKIRISVFNRWGVEVYHGNNLNQFWDGTFKGEKVPNGVYIFLMEYEWTDTSGPRNNRVAQDVTLIR